MMAGTVRRLIPTIARSALIALVAAGAVAASFDQFSIVNYRSYALIGSILIIRRPRHAVGWLLLILAGASLGTSSWPGMDVDGLKAGTAPLIHVFLAWVSGWVGGVTFLTYTLLTIVFPSGRLPSGAWRIAALALMAPSLLVVVLIAISPIAFFTPIDSNQTISFPNPFTLLPPNDFWLSDALPVVGTGVPMVALTISVGSLIVRYRRSTGILRVQFRWVVSALTFVVLAVAFGLFVASVFGDQYGLGWLPAIFAFPSVPLAIGVAVTRYRLFEIDRLVSRTIGYGVVTAVLFAVFGAVNIGLQGLLNAATGNEPLVVAGSTLLVAALFNPLRIRVQRVVDRRFNRARYDAERTVERFSGRLRDELDLSTLAGELQRTTSAAVQPTVSAVWLRESGR